MARWIRTGLPPGQAHRAAPRGRRGLDPIEPDSAATTNMQGQRRAPCRHLGKVLTGAGWGVRRRERRRLPPLEVRKRLDGLTAQSGDHAIVAGDERASEGLRWSMWMSVGVIAAGMRI